MNSPLLRTRPLAVALAFAGAVSAASPGSSLAQSDEDRARALSLFTEGDAAEAAGKCETAIEKFREAMGYVETAQLWLRVGRCEQKLGLAGPAAEALSRGLELAQGDAQITRLGKGLLEGLLPKVSKVTLAITPVGVDGLRVVIDGREVRTAGAVFVGPGHHLVMITGENLKPYNGGFDSEAGREVTVSATLEPKASPEKADEPTRFGAAPWIVLASSAPFLGATIGFAVVGSNSRARAYEELAGPAGCAYSGEGAPVCPASYEQSPPNTPPWKAFDDEVRRSNLFVGLSIGSAALTAGLLATGIGLAVTNDDDPPTVPVSVAPWLGPGVAGASVGGSF